jgi:hypothetical protein
MLNRNNLTEYERLVAMLEGDAFEEEFCARLQTTFVDFQRIPAKPQGDGGLDGLSHSQERAYCCYGPEQEARKLGNKGLKDDIISKFSGDLRRLLELDFDNRKLIQTSNDVLGNILSQGRKIKHICLVVSWFESNQVIGPLNTKFADYKKSSLLNYVDEGATLNVWGPKELAALGAVDEHTLFRIQNPALIASVQAALASELVKDGGGSFDAKFDDLKRRRMGAAVRIDKIAQQLRDAWAAEIALDNDLSQNSLGLHQVLESVRANAALSAQVKSMIETDPYKLIETMNEEVERQLNQGFGNRFGPLTPRITHGVVASLIGECPIDWRDDDV